MIINEVVFDTLAEAEAKQELDSAAFLSANEDTVTKRWAVPMQRLDGKWAYPVCPVGDYTGFVVEPRDASNYAVEEV